ncbi:MAG: condensation domain-containing protein, partial [Acidobacteria bacterium]|nr:condensation domain-containing protein [Acidobacteriota bacterium]
IFQHSVFILNGRPRRGLHHSAFITQHSMLYCTGDLARWLPAGPPTGGASGGVIDFLGRIDQQVKIRGFRIELEEIQNQLLTHEAIKEAVVIARTTRGGDKYLCAYFVPSNKVTQPDSDELKKYLALRLPDYMIPSYIITLPELPLNRNGKIDRHLLPEPFEKTQESHIPPRDKMEEELVTMFADVLDINAEQIGINTNFFKNGGHSLKAVILIAKIHRVFHAAVSLSQVFKNPTIEKLAQFIKTAQFDKYTSIPAVEKKEYYPLSPIQRRFYILYAMQGVDTAFNLPESVIIEGLLDPDQLEKAVQMLIERHETLRTSFTIVNGEAVQVVHECVEFHIDRLKADEKNLQELVVSFMQPFDLKKAPLLRVKWVKIENFKSLLYIETHHILSDGTSQSIMIRDLLHLYGNKKLPSLRIQYKDVAVWQTSQEGQTFTAKYEKYWLNQFKDKVPTLNLFTDFPRPALQSFKGNHIYFTLAGDVYREIMLLKEKTGTTLFTILLTTLNILLFKYTGNEDIVIGTPVAGRHDPEMENVLGVFINPLALRNKPNRDKKLAEFLNEVKENTLAAFENQAFPFDDLIEKTGIKRDTKRNPFFDIDLVLLNMNKPHWEIEGLTITNYPCGQDITQMDIAFYVSEQQVENGMQIDFILFYCTDLFTRETMERFAGHFKAILQILLENKDIYLKDIQISYQLEKTQTNAYDSLEDF